jgi:hypothetical protein
MAAKLKPLLPEIVFLGGCTTGLMITDPGASPVLATDDVDIIVEVASYAEYSRFSKRLRSLGFAERLVRRCADLQVVDRPYETRCDADRRENPWFLEPLVQTRNGERQSHFA